MYTKVPLRFWAPPYITSCIDAFDGHIHTPRITTDFSVFCQLTRYLIVVKYWPHLMFCIHETNQTNISVSATYRIFTVAVIGETFLKLKVLVKCSVILHNSDNRVQ